MKIALPPPPAHAELRGDELRTGEVYRMVCTENVFFMKTDEPEWPLLNLSSGTLSGVSTRTRFIHLPDAVLNIA